MALYTYIVVLAVYLCMPLLQLRIRLHDLMCAFAVRIWYRGSFRMIRRIIIFGFYQLILVLEKYNFLCISCSLVWNVNWGKTALRFVSRHFEIISDRHCWGLSKQQQQKKKKRKKKTPFLLCRHQRNPYLRIQQKVSAIWLITVWEEIDFSGWHFSKIFFWAAAKFRLKFWFLCILKSLRLIGELIVYAGSVVRTLRTSEKPLGQSKPIPYKTSNALGNKYLLILI